MHLSLSLMVIARSKTCLFIQDSTKQWVKPLPSVSPLLVIYKPSVWVPSLSMNLQRILITCSLWRWTNWWYCHSALRWRDGGGTSSAVTSLRKTTIVIGIDWWNNTLESSRLFWELRMTSTLAPNITFLRTSLTFGKFLIFEFLRSSYWSPAKFKATTHTVHWQGIR